MKLAHCGIIVHSKSLACHTVHTGVTVERVRQHRFRLALADHLALVDYLAAHHARIECTRRARHAPQCCEGEWGRCVPIVEIQALWVFGIVHVVG